MTSLAELDSGRALSAAQSLKITLLELMAESECLEVAAQQFASTFYETFSDSLAMARVFGTVPQQMLPPNIREAVSKKVQGAGVESRLHGNTPVLTLLGTRGKNSRWNDRRDSADHQGVPLISSDFIAGVPMMSRLLQSLGLELSWLDGDDTGMISKSPLAGVFFVEDASTARDGRDRLIIPQQDFVKEAGVQSVFGFGGSYSSGDFFALIAFCTVPVNQNAVKMFLPLATAFGGATNALVEGGLIFSDSDQYAGAK
jgi:hypothetical protein